MASRTLRKLQREQEQRRLEDKKEDHEEEAAASSEDENGSARVPPATRANAFDMLNDAADDEDQESQDSEAHESPAVPPSTHAAGSTHGGASLESSAPPRKQKRKKKKKKAAETARTRPAGGASPTDPQLDEIDSALQSLHVAAAEPTSGTDNPSPALLHFYELLAVDTRHLNALNEMKKLFGSVVLEGDGAAAAAAAPGPAGRRRGRGPQPMDLGRAIGARNSPVSRGQGLAGLALRRNVFMLGKEEWPKASSGGLGMEVVEKAWDATTEYRFVHSKAYQDVQRQFDACVDSLDPERVVSLLQYNPYHISTLLQVSEIAKQQGDQSVSADLLERALFSFGRSVHSSFHTALAEGKARLDFRRPENREFWLASWRYIGSLAARATSRTAFEWAKLLLSLDPEGDPYAIRWIIDQLALRGGQFEQLIHMAAVDPADINWGQDLPNVKISIALAHHKLQHAAEARACLFHAITEYPWVFTRLYQELNVGDTPTSLWAKRPRSPREELQMEAYVRRAKDLWNTPEAISLLSEVAATVTTGPSRPFEEIPLTLSEERHVMLSDMPSLIALLPRSFIAQPTTASDPFPPEDSVLPPGLMEENQSGPGASDEDEAAAASRATTGNSGSEGWLYHVVSRFGIARPSAAPEAGEPQTTEPDTRAAEEEEEDDDDNDALPEATPAPATRVDDDLHSIFTALGDMGILTDHQIERLLWDTFTNLADIGLLSAIQEDERRAHSGQPSLPDSQYRFSLLTAGIVRACMIHLPADDDDLEQLDEDDQEFLDEEISQAQIRRILAYLRSILIAGTILTMDDGYEVFVWPPPPAPPLPPPDNPETLAREADERNQRWLAGRGMALLRAFAAAHGTDEAAWRQQQQQQTTAGGAAVVVDEALLEEYAERVERVRDRTARTFIVEYALQQGTSVAMRDLVKRFVERRAGRRD